MKYSPKSPSPTGGRTESRPAAAAAPGAERLALLLVQLGAFAVVLVALPYKVFDLERHAVPKELVLHVVALLAGLVLLARARRLTFSRIDLCLVGFLGLGIVSGLFADNWWLAVRSVGLSLAGAAMFWISRSIARAGLARPLLIALGAAVVVGACTALFQAYGLVTSLSSLSRAPGGTFGNRNFMAHLVAIGLPVILLSAFEARRRRGFAVGAIGIGILSAALVLSRSRAAWLAVGVTFLILLIEGWRGGLWRSELLRKRSRILGISAVIGAALALALPNSLEWKSDSPYLDSLRSVTNYKEGSGKGRLVQYGRTLRMSLKHPLLGVGPGNWAVEYPRFAAKNDPSLDGQSRMTSNPWPSSDWMAILSERGIPAFLLITLVGIGSMMGAWLRWRNAVAEDDVPRAGLPALALCSVLVATGVVGAFDAVLLLPIPALFVWTILGALSPGSSTVRAIALDGARRWQVMAMAAVAGLILVTRSGSQARAMEVYSNGMRAAELERASRIDPGNYRIHMMLAVSYMQRSGCARARPHALAAHDLYPNAPAPKQLLSECPAPRR
ncbi:MAG: O-antigen ligase family protein [Gemmatimonadota bacterium]